jgi:serine O-acetyltransferase
MNSDPNEETPRSNCELADVLALSYQTTGVLLSAGHELPSRVAVASALEILRELMLPGSAGCPAPPAAMLRSSLEGRLASLRVLLTEQVCRGLHVDCPLPQAMCDQCQTQATQLVARFFNRVPDLRQEVLLDVQAAFEGDPAARSLIEVAWCYPGVRAVTVYRIAHTLLTLGAQIVPRMMTEQAHTETGIDIHPGARIGQSFFIDHGTGVVIGETSTIGHRVRIYQGVTLGAISLPTGKTRQQANRKRHPTIEDDVLIYANATILGGETVIGRGSIIGGNTWVTESVPPGGRVSNPCRG